MLLNKYDFGIGGRRPAKTFSKGERERERERERDVLIDSTIIRGPSSGAFMVKMVKRCCSANDDIDRIYEAYGYKTSVTKNIKNYKILRRPAINSSSDIFF